MEWLFNELERIDKVYYRNTIVYTDARKEAFQQAKEMEKEQKANTWNNAINAVEKDKWESFEQYYEQTYE
jgi:hypothetical protein